MNSQDKKLRILEAAVQVFGKKGFDAASIQDVAREAGVAKGTVYLYFESKDELIRQVYRHCYQMDVKACQTGVWEEKDVIGKLCRRMDNIMEFALTHPLEAQIEVVYPSLPQYGMNQNACLQEMYEDIEAVIRDGIEKGECKSLPASLLTRIYYGIATAVYGMLRENPQMWQDASMREQCHQIVKDSMSKMS